MPSVELLPGEVDALQETLLGEALEHAPIGAIVLDENGHYLAANRTACRLTGYSREELLERGPHGLTTEPDRVATNLEAMAMGDLANGTTRMRCHDGTSVSIEYRVGATRSGGLPHFVLVFWEHHPDE
jgi:two-component system, sensor histidine kinase and response regulator